MGDFLKKLRGRLPGSVDEDALYALVADELERGLMHKGTWTKALAEAGMNENLARAHYLKFRVWNLKRHSPEVLDLLASLSEAEAATARLESLLKSAGDKRRNHTRAIEELRRVLAESELGVAEYEELRRREARGLPGLIFGALAGIALAWADAIWGFVGAPPVGAALFLGVMGGGCGFACGRRISGGLTKDQARVRRAFMEKRSSVRLKLGAAKENKQSLDWHLAEATRRVSEAQVAEAQIRGEAAGLLGYEPPGA